METSLDSINNIYKQLSNCISSVFKIKEQIQTKNNDLSEDMFYKHQTIKEEFYKKTMKLTDDQYKKLTHTLLEESKRSLKMVCSQLDDLSDASHCWDCDHLMCYNCAKKLEDALISIQDVINNNSNII